MRVPYLHDQAIREMATYDEIYVQSWNEALKECEAKLERGDHERALLVRSLQDFRSELDNLVNEFTDAQSKKAIMLIHPTLDQYETFAKNFVTMMENPVDVSMMWGLLFLVFKLALGDKGSVGPLSHITKWLEKIGHKLRTSNECSSNISDIEKVKGDTLEVNKEIVVLWLNIIMTFRNQSHGREVRINESAWESLTTVYNSAGKQKI
ncbi:hypothetical protein BDV96DRAFT_51023 [Lophiotrema nucula]|uniref:Fungal STAND N-terminal Goodbye domain-containing protein n=1 Tax=Lophiotrema nucula TaxID=690887 RepID=A0A6A5ZCA4_9PLEO|nr:hypothetical protein BDV96DRAFT_51023 [Lophiotrema nucula]